ncbi:MAG: RnfABCDGE type electron transport complex subunit D [Pseudomonadales bacterium]
MAIQIHAPATARHLFHSLVWASLPAALIGIWNLGFQLLTAQAAPTLFAGLHLAPDPDSIISCLAAGAVVMAPLLATATLVSGFWAWGFSTLRRVPVDAAWFPMAWLFVLLLPPSTSLPAAALAMSFAAVVGAHIFGGSGRYLASPALLGALFLTMSYPEFAATPLSLSEASITSSWAQFAANGIQDNALLPYALGREIGAIGAVSAFACLAGALYLIYAGTASWRIVAGGILGAMIFSTVLSWTGIEATLPGQWHLALGNLAFTLAFLVTDPGAAPLTRPSRWLLGFTTGALTVLIRTLDPVHPEAVLHAALLSMLAVPLWDYLVVRRATARGPAARARGPSARGASRTVVPM